MGWMTLASGFESQQRQKIPLFSEECRPVLEPIYLPLQWIQGAVSQE